ncbi:MAG: hypothetical protein HYS80_00280, partial [Candidatus Aenigmarchaeota archaeon]|nr:hypothetical protein [Candidatus Aenigmarchaeota archaeon]
VTQSSSGDGDVNYTLWRGDNLVSSSINGNPSESIRLAAATYNYKINTSGTFENYTTNSTGLTRIITVSQGSPLNNMSYFIDNATANKTVTYPTTVEFRANVSALLSPDTPTFNLYRNDTLIGSGNSSESMLLRTSIYELIFNTTGNANWTSAQRNNLVLTINKGQPAARLALNGTESNRIYARGAVANLTAFTTASPNELTVRIFANYTGTEQETASGTTSVTNLTNTGNLAGMYLIKSNVTGNANWTGNSTGVSYIMTVVEGGDVTSPRWLGNRTHPPSPTDSFNKTYTFNVSWTDNQTVDVALIEHNFTGAMQNATMAKGKSITDGNEYTFNITNLSPGRYAWKSYANDTSNNFNKTSQFIYEVYESHYERVNIVLNVNITIETKNLTNTTIEFFPNSTLGEISVNVTRYLTAPINKTLATVNANEIKYINISKEKTLNESTVKWVLIKIHYTQDELDAANIDEDKLAIYRFNSISDEWVKLSTNLNFVYSTGIDKTNKFVWVNITGFSLFGLGGESKAQTVTPTAATGPTPSGALPASIEIIQYPVIKSVVQNESSVIKVTMKNIGDLIAKDMSLGVAGIPANWYSVSPTSATIEPKQTKDFDVNISTPFDATPGDYEVKIKLLNAESTFTLRVQQFTLYQETPTIARSVDINAVDNKTNVEIGILNSLNRYSRVKIVEVISKDLAKSVDELEFSVRPSKIIERDPIVEWNIKDLESFEKQNISYSISKIVTDRNKMVYWSLDELTVTTGELPKELKLLETRLPERIYPLISNKFTITVKNNDLLSRTLEIAYELPEGWKIEPETIRESIPAGEEKRFEYSITPSLDSSGNYLLKSKFKFDGDLIVKEYSVEVIGISRIILYGLVIAIALASFLFIYKIRRYK